MKLAQWNDQSAGTTRPLGRHPARRTTAARHLVDADADVDLFALRAMTTQPMHVLARITDDPVGAWRRRDARLIRELGSLELRAAGLRPPRVTP